MTIGIISDTHDHMEHINKATALFKSKKVDFVIHAGDHVNPMAVSLFKGLKLKGVFGNNDGDKYRIMKMYDSIGGEIEGEIFESNKDGLDFIVYHGTNPEITQALIKCGKYDIVISGHTHKKEEKIIGETLAINPGTAHGFGKEATIAVFDTVKKTVEFIEIR